ncbi:hypothetical protein LAZ67_8003799 [Cordylochernes scorpioides]|uniref:RNA polymerase alpha subunit C-terminal domain-containing protein n=1 Tax=Cordylochernes scorpioides TaxID=51811 RepID=A0ABY6KRV2_9ARAC|nr:hypothetical protein LAZ67_8003799 [Cordylochernes scorpioides]
MGKTAMDMNKTGEIPTESRRFDQGATHARPRVAKSGRTVGVIDVLSLATPLLTHLVWFFSSVWNQDRNEEPLLNFWKWRHVQLQRFPRLINVYKEAIIDVSNVRRWMKDSEVVRHLWMTNHVVVDLICHDRRITIRELCNIRNVGSKAIETMIEHLGYRKIYSKWVPKKLNPDQRDQIVQLCQELLDLYEAQKDTFLQI